MAFEALRAIVQAILKDSSGNDLSKTNGAAQGSDPGVTVLGYDGTNARIIKTNTSGQVQTDPNVVPTNAIFTVIAPNVVLASGASLLSLVNTGSAVSVELLEVWLINVRTSTLTGGFGLFSLRRITSHSGGTLLTPLPYATADSLSGTVTARTLATVAGTGNPYVQKQWYTDEVKATLSTDSYQNGIQNASPFWRPPMSAKPISLAENEGIMLRCDTAVNGNFDVQFVFRQV